MNINEYKKKIEIAKKASEEFEEPYKSISFEIILKKLLDQEFQKKSLYSPEKRVEENKKSLIDFIREKKVTNHTERILCMVYYLFKFKGVDPFTSDDIKKSYSVARTKGPINISDFLNKICEKGFFMNKGQKEGLKAYSLTLIGIEYVEKLGEVKKDVRE